MTKEEYIRLRRIWKKYRRKRDRVQDLEKEKEKEFRKVKKELKNFINKAKSEAWQNLIKSIEEDPWGLLYRLVLDKLRRNSPNTLTESLDTTVLEDTLDSLFPKKKKEKERIDMADQWRNEYDITTQEIFRIVKKRHVFKVYKW